MLKLTYHGNPNIGAFCTANNNYAFISPSTSEKLERAIKENLKVEIIKTTIFSSPLIGIYTSLNSSHIIVPYLIEEEELSIIKEAGITPIILKGKENAWGNLVVMNDKGIIASPYVSKENLKIIEDNTGLETLVMEIANYKSVGALLFSTNKGSLITYKAREEEIEKIKSILKTTPITASINMGSQFVSLGLTANEKGYVVGELTTGVEIARIEEGLDLIRS